MSAFPMAGEIPIDSGILEMDGSVQPSAFKPLSQPVGPASAFKGTPATGVDPDIARYQAATSGFLRGLGIPGIDEPPGSVMDPGVIGNRETFDTAEGIGTGVAIAGTALPLLPKVPKVIGAIADELAAHPTGSRSAQGGVIKLPGGQWRDGSVEKELHILKSVDSPSDGWGPTEEVGPSAPHTERRVLKDADGNVIEVREAEKGSFARSDAMDKWVDRNLRNYIKKDMATEGDPIRALAGRGVIHAELPMYGGVRQAASKARASRGFPEEGSGVSSAAKNWEDSSDYTVSSNSAIVESSRKGAPDWIHKLPAEERVYLFGDGNSNLQFGHLVDELANAVNPNSGLPIELMLPLNRLDKVSVPQAVEHVAKINAWRMNNLKEANLEAMKDMPVHKDYSDPNITEGPKGDYKIVQLTKPGEFKAESEAMGHSVRGYDTPENGGHPDYGHGGFEAIKDGRAKVYSLRDSKTGEPHVTIEVSGVSKNGSANTVDNAKWKEWFDSVGGREGMVQSMQQIHPNVNFDALGNKSNIDLVNEYLPDVYGALGGTPVPPRITQIKGKGNAKPADKYLPYVQDFVKSGKWGGVDDLHHTDLYSLDTTSKNWQLMFKSRPEMKVDQRQHIWDQFRRNAPDDMKYVTQEEVRKWADEHPELLKANNE